MSILVSDIVYAAYRIAGILPEPGRGYSTAEGTDGLKVLNTMLDGFRAERLMVYAIIRNTFTIVPNRVYYTIAASGAQLALDRPEKIENAGLIYTTNNSASHIEIPLRLLSDQEWAALSPKDMVGLNPYMAHYEPRVPAGYFYLWPIPTVANDFSIYSWQVVSEFTALTDPVVVPPAYREMLEYNLARRFSHIYPDRARMSPDAVFMANKALAKVKAINSPTLLMQTERAAGSVQSDARGQFDILSNVWR